MRVSSMILPACVTTLLLNPGPASLAQMAPPPVTDDINLSLQVEDWVKAESARIILVIDTAGQAGGLSRADLLKAAEAVVDRTDWRVIAMDKVSDSAGLDRWRAMLETRLPEGRLAGLAERAKRASKPGQQVRVASVRFEPTLQEMEGARATLRSKLYARIKDEIALLQQTFPDRHYRVQSLRFNEENRSEREFGPPPAPFIPPPEIQITQPVRTEMIEEASPVSGGGGQEDKLIVQAMVSLGAFAAPTP